MKDDKEQFNNYCLQQWTEYVERTKGKHEEPMSYKDYLKKNKKLFKKIWKIWHEEPMSYKDYLKRIKKLFKKIWKIWSRGQ